MDTEVELDVELEVEVEVELDVETMALDVFGVETGLDMETF